MDSAPGNKRLTKQVTITLLLFGLPILYIFSSVPVAKVTDTHVIGWNDKPTQQVVLYFYSPLVWLYIHNIPIYNDFFDWYSELWDY